MSAQAQSHSYRTLKKNVSVNPLKMSQPLGGALAFLGIEDALPLFHGSQGCTAFGLVLLVRHFREAIPLQTTAMNEVTTILGGYDNIEAALKNIWKNNEPSLIGMCTTGLTETKGEDMDGNMIRFRQRNPDLDKMEVVHVSTPDFDGGLEDGFAAAVEQMVRILVKPVEGTQPGLVNVLAGCHLTPGDITELREIFQAFGLQPVFLPDLGRSLTGRIPDNFTAKTLGGTKLDEIRNMGRAQATFVLGEHMTKAGQALHEITGVPNIYAGSLMDMGSIDDFLMALARISGNPVPVKYREQREFLTDAMMDAHFFTGNRRVAVGLEPEMLVAYSRIAQKMGCKVVAAVSPTPSPVLEQIADLPVVVGDHGDMEALAGEDKAEILISNSHARQAAEHLEIPLMRVGLPCFDRLGAGHRVNVGYRGLRDTIFELGNVFLAAEHEHRPEDFAHIGQPDPEDEAAAGGGHAHGA